MPGDGRNHTANNVAPLPGDKHSSRSSQLIAIQNGLDRDGSSVASQSGPDAEVPLVGRKRKTTGTPSRGVANLTPEQLAKKRANDREAQRAIRERTKTQIETLQQKVRELSSQKPYLDLQAALKEKEAVEAENREIKKRLATVIDLIQPLIGKDGIRGHSSHCLDNCSLADP